jgi:hypothetical protein
MKDESELQRVCDNLKAAILYLDDIRYEQDPLLREYVVTALLNIYAMENTRNEI